MTVPRQRPKTVEAAFWLSVVSAVIVFVTLGVVLSALHVVNSLIDASHESVAAGGWSEVIGNALGGSVLLSVVVSVLGGVLVLTVVSLMRMGRNWARVVVTVLNVAGLGWLVTSGRGFDLGSPSAFGLMTIGVSVASLVLLYVPASNRYFASRRI
ncbi:hypothetical protein [Allokutzneria albata]|uniref:DUF2127 domain-containing protein n=1 Tax=Allokutzneria albata TaxID=211114 RepID=A0A1G9Z4X1_ALLAB|nr:hypothetical protein [Allokutzneria albata]SDN16247.1 hypothetical protein SAMN04489726_5261 [Allokutzneria albata]